MAPLWSPGGRELFFISRGQAMSVPVETAPTFRPGTPKSLLELPPFYSSAMIRLRRQWDIAPDGKRFLVVNPAGVESADEPSQARMIVVLNWFEELRRLVPRK